MKLVLLVAVVLIVLIFGGGVAYLTLFSFSPQQSETEVVEKKKQRKLNPANFMKFSLKPFTVPITSRRNRYIGVEITMAGESEGEDALERLPRLRSAILEELYEVADQDGKAAGVLDFRALDKKLLAVVGEIVGENEVVKVTVTDITKKLTKGPKFPETVLPEKKSGGH